MYYNFFLVKVLKRLKCLDFLGVNYIFTYRFWDGIMILGLK